MFKSLYIENTNIYDTIFREKIIIVYIVYYVFIVLFFG